LPNLQIGNASNSAISDNIIDGIILKEELSIIFVKNKSWVMEMSALVEYWFDSFKKFL